MIFMQIFRLKERNLRKVKRKLMNEVHPDFWTGKISIFVPSHQDAFATIPP